MISHDLDMPYLWPFVLIIACFCADRFAPRIKYRKTFSSLAALFLASGIYLSFAALSFRPISLDKIITDPQQAFSFPGAMLIAAGIMVLIALNPTVWPEDNDDDDDPSDDNDPWGPDFDQERSRWERPKTLAR